jgi:subtilase family serine protease
VIENNTPRFFSRAKDLGPEDSSKVIDVTIWLKLHNHSGFDSLAAELYDPTSPHYRNWLTRTDFSARFAPSADEARVVESFFKSHNLQIVTVGPESFYVKARGSIADVQNAFQVQIDRFRLRGHTYSANTSDPVVSGPAAALVRVVSGLDNLTFEHNDWMKRIHDRTSKTSFVAADAEFFTSHCFPGVKTETYTTNGGYPTATFTGNGFYTSQTNPGCGYTPPEIWTAYNLKGLYEAGFDGTGQTIVIIDFCGSPTILKDANAFSARFGLPALTSSNFKIINQSPADCAGEDPEINEDVEWAHAIAPGANIDLLITGFPFFNNNSLTDETEYYAIINGLGNIISGSYGTPEYDLSVAEVENEDLINEVAAAFGISANFSSGDVGDWTYDIGPPDYPPTVQAPADSAFATAVGGITLALNSDNTIDFQIGWGNNENYLETASGIVDPPFTASFENGSGGGPSAIIKKPTYQNDLPGAYRRIPDISWLADGNTPGVILITIPGAYPPQQWIPAAGTSLACPMFSALWAIANQEAGTPLGQAARSLYSMPGGTITDVTPLSSKTNVTDTIHNSASSTSHYSSAQLADPLEGEREFYSVIYDDPYQQDLVLFLTFGTDSGLETAVGWDNVTGLGVPNPKAFADYFNPAYSK